MFAVRTEKAIMPIIIHRMLYSRAGTDRGAVSPYLEILANTAVLKFRVNQNSLRFSRWRGF